MRYRRLVPLAAALMFLAACGGTPEQAPPVASLPSAAPSAAQPTVAGTSGPAGSGSTSGVRLRLDTSDAEEARLWEEWKSCMFANGGKELTAGMGAQVGTSNRLIDVENSPREAHEKCQAKQPLPPVELDERTNPNYAAQWQEMIRCLRKNGLMVHSDKPGEWTYDSSDNSGIGVDTQESLQDRCMLEVFSGKK
jgi:hypothetical protein